MKIFSFTMKIELCKHSVEELAEFEQEFNDLLERHNAQVKKLVQHQIREIKT